MLNNRQSTQPLAAGLASGPDTGSLESWVWTHLAAARSTIAEWRRRHRSRQTLRALSPYQIRDFCLDPIAAEQEAAKPFWRA